MSKALYPGSFDPMTLGHLDIIERSSKLFEHVYIGTINNVNKKSLFTIEERQAFLVEATQHLPNVSVISFDGLSVEAAKAHEANVLIRGLRAISDYEYELQLASTNLHIAPNIETLFLMARTEYSYVSSSLVKEIASYHENVTSFTTETVAKALTAKYRKDE